MQKQIFCNHLKKLNTFEKKYNVLLFHFLARTVRWLSSPCQSSNWYLIFTFFQVVPRLWFLFIVQEEMCPQPKPHIHENNSSDDATDKPLTPVLWSYSQIEFSVPIRYIIILILIAFLCFRDYSRRVLCFTPIRLYVHLSTALEKFV